MLRALSELTLPMRQRQVLRTVVLVFAMALTGCTLLRPVVAPVPVIVDIMPGDSPPSQRVLLVFLPGAGDTPADLVREGFVEQVRQRGLAADVVVPDLHVRYYTGLTFEQRLMADVIGPARAKGYQQIWLAGISLGGFGSLMVSRLNPGMVDGVIALAPFIASNSVLDEVRQAGGLARWREPVVEGDWQRDLLRWLQGYGDPSQRRPALYIGYGTEDGFSEFNAAVGALLPKAHVRSAPGGHDWGPWKQLWGEFLDVVPLPKGGSMNPPPPSQPREVQPR